MCDMIRKSGLFVLAAILIAAFATAQRENNTKPHRSLDEYWATR